MEERTDEGKIKGAIDAISLEKTEKIVEQMKTCICMVYGDSNGTGFFCKIEYNNKKIPVLITNYHIISDEFIKNKKQLKISINNEQIFDIISINDNSKIYSSIRNEYDIMIIKLDEEKNIYHYLELDEHLFDKDQFDIYEDKSIYILHYPMGEKIHVSFGYGIQRDNEYYINHLCNTEYCSSGSPILNLKTNKVIGIHKGAIMNKNNVTKTNIGIWLKDPLNELKIIKKDKEIKPIRKNEIKKEKEIFDKNEILNQIRSNEIKITVKINKKEINKDIYFLDNTNGIYNKIKHYHDNLKELNESNTELYINDKIYKYKKYFNPDKEGIYLIKLKFNISIKDCSFMFYNCNNIININLSSFQDTKNVNNMSWMFGRCKSLESLPDISKWNTSNVNDMSYMFSYCESLKSLPDISKWNTSNVNDMSFMFCGCNSLESLPDISKWNTKNVKNLNDMFHGCYLLKNIPNKFDLK